MDAGVCELAGTALCCCQAPMSPHADGTHESCSSCLAQRRLLLPSGQARRGPQRGNAAGVSAAGHVRFLLVPTGKAERAFGPSRCHLSDCRGGTELSARGWRDLEGAESRARAWPQGVKTQRLAAPRRSPCPGAMHCWGAELQPPVLPLSIPHLLQCH